MEIDFHFGVTYVVSRIAGLNHDHAQIVATSSQYVDDTVNTGILKFTTGETFYRMSTAHKKSDYHMVMAADERRVWIPFHFLPGNDLAGAHDLEFYNRIVCRPNSLIAQAMAKNCIVQQSRPFGLHQLGITAHVFIDTWAHQGFAGVKSPVNVAKHIRLIDPPESNNFFQSVRREGLKAAVLQKLRPKICELLNTWFPMGHGSVLHYPDHPYRKWRYENGHGQIIERNNPQDFLEAADQLCKLIQRYILKDPDAVVRGLDLKDKELIAKMISEIRIENRYARNQIWLNAIKNGEFSFGVSDPQYLVTGKGSWKYDALSIDGQEIPESQKIIFSESFLNSNWKLFHDAAKAHQFEILTEILPAFGIIAV